MIQDLYENKEELEKEDIRLHKMKIKEKRIMILEMLENLQEESPFP